MLIYLDQDDCGPIQIQNRIECAPPGTIAAKCREHGCCFDPQLMMCYFPGQWIEKAIRLIIFKYTGHILG